jgi:hypothetical protein
MLSIRAGSPQVPPDIEESLTCKNDNSRVAIGAVRCRGDLREGEGCAVEYYVVTRCGD